MMCVYIYNIPRAKEAHCTSQYSEIVPIPIHRTLKNKRDSEIDLILSHTCHCVISDSELIINHYKSM